MTGVTMRVCADVWLQRSIRIYSLSILWSKQR